jgi:hypothetical protein
MYLLREMTLQASHYFLYLLNSYALACSHEGVFWLLVTLLGGDIWFSTDFSFVLHDTLPATADGLRS